MMVLRILPWAIWATLVIFSVATYSGLPSEIPQHLNAAGEVTRSAQRSWMVWMLVPLIAGATQGLLTGLTLALPKSPNLFSFQQKERFLKLPEAYRGDVIPRMQQAMEALGALGMVFLFVVQVILWRAALGHASKSALPLLMVGTALFIPLAFWLTSRVNKAVDAADKKWRAATGGTGS